MPRTRSHRGPLLAVLSDDVFSDVVVHLGWYDRLHVGATCTHFRALVDGLLLQQLDRQLSVSVERIMKVMKEKEDALEAHLLEHPGVMLMLESEFSEAEAELRGVFCAANTMLLAHHRHNSFKATGLIDKLVTLLDSRAHLDVAAQCCCPCDRLCPLQDVPEARPPVFSCMMGHCTFSLRGDALCALAANCDGLRDHDVDSIVAAVVDLSHAASWEWPEGVPSEWDYKCIRQATESGFEALATLSCTVAEQSLRVECEAAVEKALSSHERKKGDEVIRTNTEERVRATFHQRAAALDASTSGAELEVAGHLRGRHMAQILRAVGLPPALGNPDSEARLLTSTLLRCGERFVKGLWPRARALVQGLAQDWMESASLEWGLIGSSVLHHLDGDDEWRPGLDEEMAEAEDMAAEEQLIAELVPEDSLPKQPSQTQARRPHQRQLMCLWRK